MSCSRPSGRLFVGGSNIISIIFKNYLHISKKNTTFAPESRSKKCVEVDKSGLEKCKEQMESRLKKC